MQKDEIKEILDKPKILMLSYGNYISLDDYVKLKDYITNLQEENKKQEELISRLYSVISDDEENLKLLQQENEKLHKELDYSDNYNIYLISRIDKAIEILKLCNSKCAKETINILQGSDKDE